MNSKQHEKEIRKTIDNYVKKHPSFPIKNLSKLIEIRKSEVHIEHIYRLTYAYEERKKFFEKKPSRKSEFGELTVSNLGQVDIWDIPFKSNFFVKQNDYKVPGSSYYGRCNTCKGNQKVTCSQCQGEARFVCSSCKGKRTSRCYSCQNGQVRCFSCGGSGSSRCYGCGGSGNKSNISGQYQKCYTCNGSGRGTCMSCRGKGYDTCRTCGGNMIINCSRCRGSGWENCSNCRGKGVERCGGCAGRGGHEIYIKVERRQKEDSIVSNTSSSEASSKIEELNIDESEFKHVEKTIENITRATISSEEFQYPKEPIYRMINQVYDNPNIDVKSSKLEISKLKIIDFIYIYDGIGYHGYSVGRKSILKALKDPISDFAADVFQESLAFLNDKKYCKAFFALKDIRKLPGISIKTLKEQEEEIRRQVNAAKGLKNLPCKGLINSQSKLFKAL